MKIYLVTEYGGQYEDSWEKVVCAYENKQDAVDHRCEIEKEIAEERKQAEKCGECNYWVMETYPDCFEPCKDDETECEGKYRWSIFDRVGARVEEVEFVRKTGKWIEKEHYYNDDVPIDEWQSARCSKCGKILTTPYMYSFYNHEFCPSCGKKMDLEEEQDA